jgi:hypothetical protein
MAINAHLTLQSPLADIYISLSESGLLRRPVNSMLRIAEYIHPIPCRAPTSGLSKVQPPGTPPYANDLAKGP